MYPAGELAVLRQLLFKYSADKVKMSKITKDHNSWSNYLKLFQKLIRSSTHHYQSIHQVSKL